MLHTEYSLKSLNTFGLDVNAQSFARFSSLEELKALMLEGPSELPVFILGGGSNLLFTQDVSCFVLRNEIKGFEILTEDEEVVVIQAGAGEVWHEFVRYTVEKGWGGLENLSLIPGSVGASPMQNIGAYGVEIKDTFVSLSAYHLASGEVHTFNHEACKFGYRESVFKREKKGEYVILDVTFKLNKNPNFHVEYGAIKGELETMGVTELSVDAISQAVMRIRSSKLPDPKVLGNAGSFFKNPVISVEQFSSLVTSFPEIPNYPQDNGTVKLAAGWLIEQAGWKGKRVGNCGMHALQALVLVNYGGATGSELWQLSHAVMDDVKNKFGITLEREVNIY